jgi:hypothetical protein
MAAPNKLLVMSAITAIMAGCLLLTQTASAQIQSTITCPAGHGYWDTLSVMMLDPGLAPTYHMEGYNSTTGDPDAYIYTTWTPGQNKVSYVKNPQGYPWDINLYDDQPSLPGQGYVYQWVTELNWTSDSQCKKFNNGSDSSTADYSFPWASRCAVPGGANSTFWNSPPPSQPYNSNYYTISAGTITGTQNLDYTLMDLLPTGTMTLYDSRQSPAAQISATTMPLQYNYTCYVNGNVNSCKSREVFVYALDTTVNPHDGVKHSYGWVQWTLYDNTTYSATKRIPPPTANWVVSTTSPPSLQNYLVTGQVPIEFDCF